MYVQTFTAKELYHSSSQFERRNFKGDKDGLLAMIQTEVVDKIQTDSFQIRLKEQEGLILNGKSPLDRMAVPI